MSHKQAKRVRRIMRSQGINPAQKAYDAIRHVCGDPKKPYESFQIALTPGCGRSRYQYVKSQFLRGTL